MREELASNSTFLDKQETKISKNSADFTFRSDNGTQKRCEDGYYNAPFGRGKEG